LETMTFRAYVMLSLALFVLSGAVTFIWVEPIDPGPIMPGSTKVVEHGALVDNPQLSLRPSPQATLPLPKAKQSYAQSLRSGRVMSVMVDPAAPVDLSAIRMDVQLDVEYCIASDIIYSKFWQQLRTPEEGRRWNMELFKQSQYRSIKAELESALSKYPDYWSTQDIRTKIEIIELNKYYKAKMELIVRPLVERAMAENPYMKPPASFSFTPGPSLSSISQSALSTKSPALSAPPPPPDKPKLFQ
jgi:hypothetical protein